MNVVQAIETGGPGGAENVLISLCQGLAKRGHKVCALLLRHGWLEAELEKRGVEVEVLELRKPVDLRFLDRLEDFLGGWKADVLHSHEFTLGLYGSRAARRLGVAHVASAHGRNFTANLKRRALGALAFRGRKGFQLATVSSDLAAHLARQLLVPRKSVAVVPNGVAILDNESLERFHGEPLRLLAVGNLYPGKNHGLLIQAVARLRDFGIAARLDILGRGEQESRLREQIREMKLDDVVHLRGFSDDVRAHLASNHALVSASLSEGLPLSFLEAMAAGLPIVAPRVGGVPELITHGEEGLLYDSEDIEALVDALVCLGRDEALRKKLGHQAAHKARSSYADTLMLDRYLQIYRQLAATDPPGAGGSRPRPG